MAKDKGKGKGGSDDYSNDEPQGPGEHAGVNAVRIHEAYVRRHLDGGAPATPEAYERAREQFRRLPGAIRVPRTGKSLSEPERKRR